jgi:hypothetical protein
MTIPHSLARAARNAVAISPLLQDPAALRTRTRPQLRRYEVCSLATNGDIVQSRQIAPALPLFENAFCAFSRGSLIETEFGPVAIEDLLPGDRVITGDGKPQMVLWKGSTTILPGRADPRGRVHNLTRIMSDSFGMQRPMSCIVAGPSARILRTPGHLRKFLGSEPTLTPVQEFVDGSNVIETAPPTPVELFHICLKHHAVIRIGGIQFETYHPGVTSLRLVSQAMRAVFLSLFPHIDQLSDFGPQAYPRSGDGEVDAMTA